MRGEGEGGSECWAIQGWRKHSDTEGRDLEGRVGAGAGIGGRLIGEIVNSRNKSIYTIYINKSKPLTTLSAKFSAKFSAKWIKAFGWARRSPLIEPRN